MRKLLFGIALLSSAFLALPTDASAQIILYRGGGLGSGYGGGLYGRSVYGLGGRPIYGAYGYPGGLGLPGYGGYGYSGPFGRAGFGSAYINPGFVGAQPLGAPGMLGGSAYGNPLMGGMGSSTGVVPGWGPSGFGELAPRMRATLTPAIPIPAAWLTPSAGDGAGLPAPRPMPK